MISDSQMDQVTSLIREVAAVKILPRFRRPEAQGVEQKSGPDDLVTLADREAEASLTRWLPDILPGSVVVGEEAVAADPAVLDRLSAEDPVFIVDPVDGTANFVEGKDTFAVMVALAHRGETLASWIYGPAREDLALARKGEGARINGEPVSPRPGKGFRFARGDVSSKYFKGHFTPQIEAAVARAGRVRQGHCSAYAYLDTARGVVDFVVSYLMSPWDHAAGALLVEEAGGAVRFLDDGEPYSPVPRDARPLLAVGSAGAWNPYSEAIALYD